MTFSNEIKQIVRRLRFALQGINLLLTDSSFIKHCLAMIMVIIAGIFLNLTMMEWVGVALCCGAVLAAEGFNTAIEILCDRVTKEKDEAIGKTKDIAAGAVLIVSVTALTVGLLVFIPAILRYLNSQ